MVSYPQTNNPEKIGLLLEAIREKGVPSKFTFRFLSSLGFSSSGERDLLSVIKYLGFIDNKGLPKQEYKRLLDINDYKNVIREKLQDIYRDLLELDNSVPNVPDDVLTGYFSRLTGDSYEVSFEKATTYKELFKISAKQSENKLIYEKKKINLQPVNLSINLPSTTDERVYETLFKHLKDFLVPQD